jgi:hypothetical protein
MTRAAWGLSGAKARKKMRVVLCKAWFHFDLLLDIFKRVFKLLYDLVVN